MKEELIKQIKEVEARRKAAFDAMMKESADAAVVEARVAEYENLLNLEKLLRGQLADVETREKGNPMAEKGVKTADMTLTEGQRFIKGLVEAVAIGSNYAALVPVEIAQKIEMKRAELVSLRKHCTIHPCSGDYELAVEGNGVTVSYTGEGEEAGESTPTLGIVKLKAYKLTALVKPTKEFLSDVAADVETWLIDVISKGYAEKEDHEILYGTGSSNGHITGVIPVISGEASQVVTAAATDAITWKDVKDLLAKLKKGYRKRCCLVMSQSVADAILEFKDGSKYIFPQEKELDSIRGHEVVISPDMPGLDDEDIAGKAVIVAGDFSYYHIADRQSLEIQTLLEVYASKGQVGLLASERIDGNLTQKEAFAVLKTSV